MTVPERTKVQLLSTASIVTGSLCGLAEGVGYWKPDEITPEMLARLQGLLTDLHLKAKQVSDAILDEMEAS